METEIPDSQGYRYRPDFAMSRSRHALQSRIPVIIDIWALCNGDGQSKAQYCVIIINQALLYPW